MMTQAAQVCMAGIMAAVFVWLSAKIAGALAGAGINAAMQGMASMGISVAGLGASKMLSGAGQKTKDTLQRNSMNYSGKPNPPGGGSVYNAKKARVYTQ